MVYQIDSRESAQVVSTLLNERPEALLVVCFCAQWCRTCGQYARDFEQLSERLPEHVFAWVDIEVYDEWIEDFDIENFPTVLIQHDGHNAFFGTMLPMIAQLERMIKNVQIPIGSSVQGPSDLRQL